MQHHAAVMLAKNGLLIVSNPSQIGRLLSSAETYINSTLYIQLLCASGDGLGIFCPQTFTSCAKYSRTIHNIYSEAARYCRNLDVRVLLSSLKWDHFNKIQTQRPIDLVIFDKRYREDEADRFLADRIGNRSDGCSSVTVEHNNTEQPSNSHEATNEQMCSHSVLGGTFDRLHLAHKLLLSEAALRSKEKITIGVTEENMLYSMAKTLWELIEPIEKRMSDVEHFLTDVCPELDIKIVPITDPFGPTKDDPTMDLIVVSRETANGGLKVNQIRTGNGLRPLEVVEVELIDEPYPNPSEEAKISSSTTRRRLLGTLLKPVVRNDNIAGKPYVVGLTGGIASGKSNVAGRLQHHGAKIIDCDKVGHAVYKPGEPCHARLVHEFGPKILTESGEVNRKVLAEIVFADLAQLEKLNSIVWPCIADQVKQIIRNSTEEVVIIEAAILSKAGWDKLCHEVWTTIIPESEAVERLKVRNALTDEEQARRRIRSQPTNKDYADAANIVFCTLWSFDFTYQQVDKAWKGMVERMTSASR